MADKAQFALEFAAAARRRDTGMERAARGATKAHAGWTSEAVLHIRRYAAAHPVFLAEHVRCWAELHGCPKPPNEKAWGPAMQQAAREGIVKADGYAKAASSNLSPKVRWRSLVYGAPA